MLLFLVVGTWIPGLLRSLLPAELPVLPLPTAGHCWTARLSRAGYAGVLEKPCKLQGSLMILAAVSQPDSFGIQRQQRLGGVLCHGKETGSGKKWRTKGSCHGQRPSLSPLAVSEDSDSRSGPWSTMQQDGGREAPWGQVVLWHTEWP